jgi:hypothetical protein
MPTHFIVGMRALWTRLSRVSIMPNRNLIRARARAFEQALAPDRRKRLGQYFTGVPLAKVLAHLALTPDIRTVLDPMAGHGDLLDAVWESAAERGIALTRLDGIEVDRTAARACRERVAELGLTADSIQQIVVEGDAFDVRTLRSLPEPIYDLVIANPPFVRYQTHGAHGVPADRLRDGLRGIFADRLAPAAERVWSTLAAGYSGLADLSVPALLLAGALVKPGGRLALVVPSTWRSRDYADVVRYLLLRCFRLEIIVEDQQPGWFCDALVRTHLIVARRLEDQAVASQVAARLFLYTAPWLEVAAAAASPRSLVGTAFAGELPEAALADWVRTPSHSPKTGIAERTFDSSEEWAAICHQSRRKAWLEVLEPDRASAPTHCAPAEATERALPPPIRAILADQLLVGGLSTLEQLGIAVGQGLRTGCNAFFYLTATGHSLDGLATVETSALFSHRLLRIPQQALQPVIRRQSELGLLRADQTPSSRVLDLTQWLLPEDARAMRTVDEVLPPSFHIMSGDLAAYVRLAASTLAVRGQHGLKIPELCAVRTNARPARRGGPPPRFWYMLPDFVSRHRPVALVPRINQDTPRVTPNRDPSLLVDANFSTFWPTHALWSAHAIRALFSGAWCRAYMECIGTPMGGGALKLEASHLRRILLPHFTNEALARLDTLGRVKDLSNQDTANAIDETVLGALLAAPRERQAIREVADNLLALASRLAGGRRKIR